MNNLEFEKPEVKTSFRIQVEKLDGGFISDITGKRKIYKDSNELVDMISIEDILKKVDDDVYHLNIDIVQKDKMDEYIDLLALNTPEQPETISIDEAKEKGIVTVDKFDPNPTKNESIVETEIVVNEHTAYKAARLKSIDWKYFDEQLSLNNAERAEVSGISQQAMYNQWRKAKEGKASFHLVQTRIGMTILAKYYEAHLGIRTSTKDQLDKLKDQMLITLRELELMAAKAKFVYSTEVNKKIEEMRKQLL